MPTELTLNDFYTKPPTKTEPEEPTKAELKIAIRRERVFELRAQGNTISQICEKLGKEGQIWSKNTIWADLHSDQANQLVQELIRQQLNDINNSTNEETRLTYREGIIDKLLPRQVNVHSKQEITETTEANVNVTGTINLLTDYENALTAATAEETRTLPNNNPQQPMDTKKPQTPL